MKGLRFWKCSHPRLSWPMSLGAERIDRKKGTVTYWPDGKDRARCLDCGKQVEVAALSGKLEIEGGAEEAGVFRTAEDAL